MIGNRSCFNFLSACDIIQQWPSTSLWKTSQKKHHTRFHGSFSQHSPHFTARLDAPKTNRTRTIAVLPTANNEVRSQSCSVHQLRVFVDNCAQTNIIILQTMHRKNIKPNKIHIEFLRGAGAKLAYPWKIKPLFYTKVC